MLYYHLVAADGIIPNIDPAAQKKKHKIDQILSSVTTL